MPPLNDKYRDGGDVRGFYTALGIYLSRWAAVEASVHCFGNPEAHRRSDRNASCSVNLASGLWNCHSCGAAGNPFHASLRAGTPNSPPRSCSSDSVSPNAVAYGQAAGPGRRSLTPHANQGHQPSLSPKAKSYAGAPTSAGSPSSSSDLRANARGA